MLSVHEPLFVNTLAHAAGAIMFGIFLFLLCKDYAQSRFRGMWLSIAAASLAFAWNLGSFLVLSAANVGIGHTDVLIALSFSSLSLLPAVLLQVSLNGRLGPVMFAGYGLSLIAVALHFAELADASRDYHQLALTLITIGFSLLTIVALVAAAQTPAETGTKPRLLATMGLALFAISFVHFGSGHGPHRWSSELVLHHAGIPVALFILLQDFRFVLLDAFVRFLANAFLATAFAVAAYRVAILLPRRDASPNAFEKTLILVFAAALLIAFAMLRTGLQRFLTRVVFLRSNFERSIQNIQGFPAEIRNEKDYLDWTLKRVGEAMSAAPVELIGPGRLGDQLVLPTLAAEIPALRDFFDLRWVRVVVPLRLAQGDLGYILLGRRRGGRRYLSEDLQALATLEAIITDQVQRFRNSEMQRLVSEAELRALQSQINPHFLFNALNTLYGIIPREAGGARQTVLNLAEILRFCLRSERNLIPLSEEMQIVRAYLDVEALRLGDRLHTEIHVDERCLSHPIPILSIQPLVENAIKHGVAPYPRAGWIKVEVKSEGLRLSVLVEDSGGGFPRDGQADEERGTGIGLENVARRLKLYYGAETDLTIDSQAHGTRVAFIVPAPIAQVVDAATRER